MLIDKSVIVSESLLSNKEIVGPSIIKCIYHMTSLLFSG